MKTILALVCSYRFEGCEYRDELSNAGNNKAKEGDKCPYCIEYNAKNPDEPLLIGSIELVEYEMDRG